MGLSREAFSEELEAIFRNTEIKSLHTIEVRASDLHRSVGSYPGPNHRMPVCCAVMRQAMSEADTIIEAPPKGDGGSLLIRYVIPRLREPNDPSGESHRSLSTHEANFQRVGAVSNTQVGMDFEKAAEAFLASQGVLVKQNFAVPVGVGRLRKERKFDLGSENPPTLVECKSHRWTAGGNSPSAKLTVWNEAMYYFAVAPLGFRKVLFVLRDFSALRGQTLAEHYVSRFLHLIPEDVEIWEFDEDSGTVLIMDLQAARKAGHMDGP